uniref:Uncharacterized protein n=1 Tax=Picea sitchensis TaxID=3332 RepID=B8LNG0_PICSI|nr:unknown [Picea sitchensis]
MMAIKRFGLQFTGFVDGLMHLLLHRLCGYCYIILFSHFLGIHRTIRADHACLDPWLYFWFTFMDRYLNFFCYVTCYSAFGLFTDYMIFQEV